MNEYLLLGRSLLRLRQATVAELAAHAGVSPVTAKSYLHKKKQDDLVEPCGTAPGAGRGRPAGHWRLTAKGAGILREELRKLSVDESGAERAEGVAALTRSMQAVSEELKLLTAQAREIDRKEWDARLSRLRRRAGVARAAANTLGNEPLKAEIAAVLDPLTGMDTLRPVAPAEPVLALPGVEVREEIGAYLMGWLKSLQGDLDDIAVHPEIHPHAHAAATPIILLDAASGRDSASELVLAAGEESGAPVLHVPIGDEKSQKRIFDIVERHLRSAAGCVSQLVLTMDSDENRQAPKLAHSYAGLAAGRSHWEIGAKGPQLGIHEQRLLRLTGSLWIKAGIAAAQALPIVAIPAGVAMIAGALSNQAYRARARAEGGSEGEGEPEYLPALCLDNGENAVLQKIFLKGGVHYHSDVSANAEPTDLLRPLPIAPASLEAITGALHRHSFSDIEEA